MERIIVSWVDWGGIPYSFVDFFPLLFSESAQRIRVLRWAMGLRVCRGRGRGLLHLLLAIGVEFALIGISQTAMP